jgi:tRNA G18 (ribose-2'-O)-methylase SpoU
MKLIRADGPRDPRLADYQEVRDKDLRRSGVFLVEGEVTVVEFARRSSFRLRSVLLSDKRVDSLRAQLSECSERLADTPLYVLPQGDLEAIVGFRIHRGVIAAGDRPVLRDLDEVLSGARLVLALEGLTNHDNVGGCFRNAAAFGVDAVILDSRCCDPLYRKAIRVSAGAALTVPWAVGSDGPSLVAACRGAGLTTVALTPRGSAPPLAGVLGALGDRPLAIVVGTEGPGLTDGVLQAADFEARIPMAGEFDSINVAVAAAVALAFRTGAQPGQAEPAPGSRFHGTSQTGSG